MKLIYITKKDQLNDFVGSQSKCQFLQSWQWGEFQEKAGGRLIRIGVEENGELVAAAAMIKMPLLLGYGYFYCPRGPIIGITNYELPITNFLFAELKKIARKENAVFLRFEPTFEFRHSESGIYKTINMQPSKTLIMDLSKSEDELLATMHQKTRYNIRLAEKKGVKIIEAGKDYFPDFWKLLQDTRERDSFRSHSKEYYLKMSDLPSDFLKIFLAEYDGKITAGIIVSFFGDTVTYVHGASANEDRNVMAPFLLQWQAIKLAKQRGFKYYDFHGIDEKKWPGVTRFKLGFGGQVVIYPGTYDLVFNKILYNLYKVLRKIRRNI